MLKTVTSAKPIVLDLLFALFATIVVTAVSFGQEKLKFPVGVGTKTLGTNAIFLATKKGFFDDLGLEVQPVLLRGTPITVQALVGESLYVALGSADSTIGAGSTGVDLLSVGGVVNGLTQVIVAGKKYKTYSDLRGTTIGVQALASGAQLACGSKPRGLLTRLRVISSDRGVLRLKAYMSRVLVIERTGEIQAAPQETILGGSCLCGCRPYHWSSDGKVCDGGIRRCYLGCRYVEDGTVQGPSVA